jgi:predicted Zn-dependent peptidase
MTIENKVTAFKTSYGLKVLHISVPAAKNVVFMFHILGGSSKESTREYGMAHFLEHMFFKGTSHRSVQRLMRDLALVGAGWNAYTSQIDVAYYIDTPLDNFDKSLELISDMFVNPEFPQKEIDVEKGVIVEEINMYKDNVQAVFFEEALKTHFAPEFGHSVLGTKDHVLSFSREDFVNYRNKHYKTNNTIFAIAGDVDVDKVKQSLEESPHLNKLKKSDGCAEVVRVKNIYASPNGHYHNYFKDNTEQSQLMITFDLPNIFGSEAYASAVMLGILGSGAHSLLFSRIREELGLCYSISAFQDTELLDDSIGLGHIYTGLSESNIELCSKEILICIEKLIENNFDNEIFECSKQDILGMLSRISNNPYALAKAYSGKWLFMDNDLTIPMLMKRIKAVTKEEAVAVANKYFSPKNFRYTCVTPQK